MRYIKIGKSNWNNLCFLYVNKVHQLSDDNAQNGSSCLLFSLSPKTKLFAMGKITGSLLAQSWVLSIDSNLSVNFDKCTQASGGEL